MTLIRLIFADETAFSGQRHLRATLSACSSPNAREGSHSRLLAPAKWRLDQVM